MTHMLMPFAGNLLTTGMGILPHKEMDRALSVAMGVDIPFWPQLPKMDYFEDMYVQASENFPGIVLEPENRKIYFSTEKFYAELENALMNLENEDFSRTSPGHPPLRQPGLGFSAPSRYRHPFVQCLQLWRDLRQIPGRDQWISGQRRDVRLGDCAGEL